MTVRTLSEIRATCTKAARGAGCPWGMAEEAGIAARILEAHGLPGVAALSALFQTPRACDCDGRRDEVACGLAEMVALSDTPPETRIEYGPMAAPLLLAASGLTEPNRTGDWRMDWPGGSMSPMTPEAAPSDGPVPDVVEAVTITRSEDTTTLPPPDWRSREVPAPAWAYLERLAAQTHVPETPASRAAGAGPDGTDND